MDVKKVAIIGNMSPRTEEALKKLIDEGKAEIIEDKESANLIINEDEIVYTFKPEPLRNTLVEEDIKDPFGPTGDGLTNKERNLKSNAVKYENIRTEPKIGRNEPCPCGSGKKYKNCCLK